MRADAHYVEQLDAPTATRTSAAARAEASTESPDILGELLRAITSIDASTRLLSRAPANLAHNVAIDLIRAEIWRAQCIAHAGRIVERYLPPTHAVTAARTLIRTVIDRAEPERRLRGYSAQLHDEIPDTCLVAGDPAGLATALSALLIAASAEHSAVGRLTVNISLDSAGDVSFVVGPASDASGSELRWLDSPHVDRAPDAASALCLRAARIIADASGGRVTSSQTAHGTTFQMVMRTVTAVRV